MENKIQSSKDDVDNKLDDGFISTYAVKIANNITKQKLNESLYIPPSRVVNITKDLLLVDRSDKSTVVEKFVDILGSGVESKRSKLDTSLEEDDDDDDDDNEDNLNLNLGKENLNVDTLVTSLLNSENSDISETVELLTTATEYVYGKLYSYDN